MRVSMATNQRRSRWWHHKKCPGLKPQRDPGTKTTVGWPSLDLKDDIFASGIVTPPTTKTIGWEASPRYKDNNKTQAIEI
jgi:hypothetical protein